MWRIPSSNHHLATFVPATNGPIDDIVFDVLIGAFIGAAAWMLLRLTRRFRPRS